MTRALGDAVMLRAGVVPTPIVQSFPIQEEVKDTSFVILMTDGISDVLSNSDLAQLVFQQSSLETTIQTILDEARRKWIGELPILEEKVDDMSCVLLQLKLLPPGS
jgi:serine/threonine protein phosphatase PrpC